MLLVCDCAGESARVVMGQMTLFGRITDRDQNPFLRSNFLPRNRDEWYTSSPSSSVTLQRPLLYHLAAPVEPITGAKDLSVIRNLAMKDSIPEREHKNQNRWLPVE